MGWMDQAETVLTALSKQTDVPYDYRTMETDPQTNQLPDEYMVYFEVDDPGVSWADNKETAHEARFQVSYYFREKSRRIVVPPLIEAAFMGAGFTRVGSASGDLPFQPDTGHNGWRCDFCKYERR